MPIQPIKYKSRVQELDEIKEINLDVKDKKILYELFQNARQSISSIAKRVQLSKEVVNYRLSRLQRTGLLTGFTAFIDVSKLGYFVNIVYFQLQNIKEEKEIIDFFVQHPSVKVIATCTGNWDLFVVFCSKEINETNRMINQFKERLKENLKEYRFATVLCEDYIVPNYLFNKITIQKLEIEKKAEPRKIKIDNKDYQILKLLVKNARTPLIEIAKNIKLSSDAVNYRIKEMVQYGIITKFIPLLNISLLNYHWYTVSFNLNQLSQREKEFTSYLKSNKNIVFIIKAFGYCDIEIDLHIKSSFEFKKILTDIRNRFYDLIRNYESTLIFNDYKYTHLPEGIAKSE